MKYKNKMFLISVIFFIFLLFLCIMIENKSFQEESYNKVQSEESKQDSEINDKDIDLIIARDIKTQLDRVAKENEDVLGDDGGSIGLGTTSDHWKKLGIDNAGISSEEEKNLYQIVAEAVKAQLKYSASKKEESLEGVKNMYLSEEFEQYKKAIMDDGGYHASGAVYHIPTDEYYYISDIKTIRFSKPRIYGGLPDRIGVINYVEFNDSSANSLAQIFIFKNVNSEWKIEKQRETIARFDLDEDSLIREIKDGK